jgi:hypothetical protein
MRSSLCVLFALSLFTACHGHDHDAYATYQACFDEHTMAESLPVQEAIVICCLDHPIAGMGSPVCGDTTASCATYLGANLTPTSATQTDITAACQDYVTQKNL